MITWLRTASRSRDAALLTVAVAAVYLATGAHPALGSSTRYVESCREMVETGDWVVPQLGYVPYLEKPILTYWLGSVSRVLFGGSDLAAQAPAALSALITVLAVYGLGCRLRDRAFGLAAGLLLLGSGFFLSMVSTLTTDMPLTACLAVAWWSWMGWDERRQEAGGRAGGWWLLAFWGALGLGFLAKGPIALILAAAGVGGFALVAGGLRGACATLWAMGPFTGAAMVAAINLPWSIAVWQRDPRLLEFFYVRINFQAFFDGEINHPGPFWYYLPVLVATLAPLSLVLVPAWVAGVWRALARVWERPRTPLTAGGRSRLYLACAALFPLAFLSVSASKLGTYILPLLPLIVVLALDQALDAFRSWSRRLLAATALALLAALALAPLAVTALHAAAGTGGAPQLCGRRLDLIDPVDLAAIDWSWWPVIGAVLGLVAVALIAALVALWRDRVGAAMVLIGSGLAALAIAILPNIDRIVRDLDASRLIAVIRARGGDDASRDRDHRDPVIIQQDVIHRYELDYALRRRMGILDHARERAMGHFLEMTAPEVPLPSKGRAAPAGMVDGDPYHLCGEAMPNHPWLWSYARLRAAWAGPQRLWVLSEYDQRQRFAAQGFPPVYVIDHARYTYLFSNKP